MSLYSFGGWGIESADVTPRKQIDHIGRTLRGLAKIPHGKSFGEVLRALPTRLSFRDMAPVCRWFEGITAQDSAGNTTPTVATVVCPDYTTDFDIQVGRRVYTFDGVGSGVGLVAERALQAHVAMWSFFHELGLYPRFVVAMADQEAESEENCKRMGLPKEEFLARMRGSQEALVSYSPPGMKLETPLLTEIAPALWGRALEQGRALSVNAGQPSISKTVQRAINERRRFYNRWAGRWLDTTELESMIHSQAREYAAVGAYLQAAIPGVFILAADSPVMGPFVRLITGAALPLLYLDRPSYH